MLLKISALLFVLAAVADAAPNDADPVEVTLFYEALCPYCSRFILRQLIPTWNRLKSTGILKVKLYAHGNAKAYQDGERWRFRCQHGTRECQLNQLTTCAQMHLNEEQVFSFVSCIEKNPYTNWAKFCLTRAGATPTPVIECASSLEGNKRQKEVHDIQSKLSPRLRYVPWILVNGNHDKTQQSMVQRGMLKYVCDHYKGTRPSECN